MNARRGPSSVGGGSPPPVLRSLPWRWRYLRDGLGTLAGAMGIESSTRVARLLAQGAFELHPLARRQIESNLFQAFGPSLSRSGCERIARQVFENVALFWVESLFCRRRLSPATWRRWVRVPDMGDWLEVARQRGPALLVTGYLGNPAVAACVVSELLPPVHVLVDPVSRMLVDRSRGVLERFRGLTLIDVKDASRRVPSVMYADGRLLVLAGPGQLECGGVPGSFLGRQGRHPATIARLAHRCGAEIIVLRCRRLDEVAFRFELAMVDRIGPPAPGTTASAITQQYLTSLDRAVREYPDQYLWTRW